jgi:hypothetical protein
MLEAPFAIIAEVIVPLVTGAIEAALYVLVASVRPWAYVLVPSFRRRTNELLRLRHPLIKAWYMLWGTVALAASVGLVVLIVSFFQSSSKPQPSAREAIAEELARRAITAVKKPAQSASHP